MNPERRLSLTVPIVVVALIGCTQLRERPFPTRSDEGFRKSVPNLQQLTVPIETYVETQDEFSSASFGGTVFCGFEPLGFQSGTSNDRVYVWVYCQEFIPTSDTVREGTGASIPAAILTDHSGNILGHEAPRDTGYEQHIHAIFPKGMVERVFAYPFIPEEKRRFLQHLQNSKLGNRLVGAA